MSAERFIVYEGIFKNRWLARKVIGETDCFWKVTPADGDVASRLVKKASAGRVAMFDSQEKAERVARQLSEALLHIEADAKRRKDAAIRDHLERPAD